MFEYEADCLVCLSSKALKMFRLCQPFIIFDCPHQNPNLKRTTIKISKFWTYIQLLLILVFVVATHNSIIAFKKSTSEMENVVCIMRVVIILGFILPASFLLTVKDRLKELETLQNSFVLIKNLGLPCLCAKSQFHRINNKILAFEIVFFTGSVSYTAYKAISTNEYAIWILEFLMTFACPNIFLYYSYTYWIAQVLNKTGGEEIIYVMNSRLLDDNMSLKELLGNALVAKTLLAKVVEIYLGCRGFQIILIVIKVVIMSVGSLYIVINYPAYIFKEEVLFKICETSHMLLQTSLMCLLANRLPELVCVSIQKF